MYLFLVNPAEETNDESKIEIEIVWFLAPYTQQLMRSKKQAPALFVSFSSCFPLIVRSSPPPSKNFDEALQQPLCYDCVSSSHRENFIKLSNAHYQLFIMSEGLFNRSNATSSEFRLGIQAACGGGGGGGENIQLLQECQGATGAGCFARSKRREVREPRLLAC